VSEIVSISLGESEERKDLVVPDGPYLLLSDIVFNQELDYVFSEEGIDSYFKSPEGYKFLGKVDVGIMSLEKLRFLGIGVELVKSDGEVVRFEVPEDYYQFVRV
jgi:hypothetical protein